MSTLILGLGHVGKALHQQNQHFLYTNRIKKTPGSIVFDLGNRSTWKLIPKVENIIWTFPAKPLNLVERFYEERLTHTKNILVLGSTSCYINKRQAEKIDENSPLDMKILRVQGEEFLRSKGATILCLAGIYDQERNPLNWLHKMLIPNPKKIVNLIHTDDIVKIIEHLLKFPQPHERYNVCDGFPRSWQEIGDRLGFEFRMDGEREVSKLLGNEKIKKILPSDFSFFPFFSLWDSLPKNNE